VIFDIGPFRLYRVEKSSTLCVSLIAFDDCPFGWEYGWEELARGETHPWINLRVGKLNILYFEPWKKGFEFWLMGFWVIISWEGEK
jgi:hypothetical protein